MTSKPSLPQDALDTDRVRRFAEDRRRARPGRPGCRPRPPRAGPGRRSRPGRDRGSLRGGIVVMTGEGRDRRRGDRIPAPIRSIAAVWAAVHVRHRRPLGPRRVDERRDLDHRTRRDPPSRRVRIVGEAHAPRGWPCRGVVRLRPVGVRPLGERCRLQQGPLGDDEGEWLGALHGHQRLRPPRRSSPSARRAMACPSRYAGRSWSAIASSNPRAAVVGSARSSAWLPAAARTIAMSIGNQPDDADEHERATHREPIARREGDHRGAGTPAASSSRATRCSVRSDDRPAYGIACRRSNGRRTRRGSPGHDRRSADRSRVGPRRARATQAGRRDHEPHAGEQADDPGVGQRLEDAVVAGGEDREDVVRDRRRGAQIRPCARPDADDR